ncbi:hypothetical protein [Cupriavidus oxalaticus]|uniref:hypothetical protein n=1 Tax=Cupriavidus oxalaticus TaxID=96344 RepID=UPI003173011B
MNKEFAMRLKHIVIAAAVAAGALAADGGWAQTTRIEVFGPVPQDSRFDTDTEGARGSRFNPYTDGLHGSHFDPYVDGLHSDRAEPAQIHRNT